jgi:MraZ protein
VGRKTLALSNKPIYYRYFYERDTDEKRRLQMPVKWRPESKDEMEQVEYNLIAWTHNGVENACLRVLPSELFDKWIAQINSLPFDDPKAEEQRRMGSKTDNVTMDRNGRICLPDGLRTLVGLGDKVLLIGCFDRFEIWDPERYKKMNSGVVVKGEATISP